MKFWTILAFLVAALAVFLQTEHTEANEKVSDFDAFPDDNNDYDDAFAWVSVNYFPYYEIKSNNLPRLSAQNLHGLSKLK